MKPRPHIDAAHVAQLRQRGSTTIGPNHARSALLVVAAALCAAPCLFALVSIVTDRGFSGALAHPGAWGALLGSAFFGLGLFILLAQLVRPPALVIDRGGVRFLRGSEGQVAAVEWKDVDDITVVRLRTTTMVNCVLTPEAAARRGAGAGRSRTPSPRPRCGASRRSSPHRASRPRSFARRCTATAPVGGCNAQSPPEREVRAGSAAKRPGQTTPRASMASATLTKPAMLAPLT